LFSSYKKKTAETTKQEAEKGGKKPKPEEQPEACHSISTALLQSVAEIGTQSTMKQKDFA
jgi:hypothetical protein